MGDRNVGPDWMTENRVMAFCDCGWVCVGHQTNSQAVLCVQAHRVSDPAHRPVGVLPHGDALKALAFTGRDFCDGVQ